jgi:DNA-directed RNA polymerase subunit RPC12/RpoP
MSLCIILTLMGVRDVLPSIVRRADHTRHVECRECGANLAPDAEDCPHCGGGVAVYELA